MALAFVWSGLCACSAQGFEKPQPPDMTDVLQRYQSPTGSFIPSDASALGTTVGFFKQAVGNTDVVGRLTGLLSDVITRVPTSGQRRMPADSEARDEGEPPLLLELPFDADGYLVFTRICGGWSSPASPDPANGKAYLTATLSRDGIDPVLWGSVESCRYRVADSLVELVPSSDRDGLRAYWGDDVRLGTQTGAGALVSLALRAHFDGTSVDLDLDLRLTGADALDYLLPAGGGWVVVRAGADDSFTVRSADGFFVCDESYDCVRGTEGVDDGP